ncbi:MAG: MerR family transcriptional regulator [Actinomycetota bacterium]
MSIGEVLAQLRSDFPDVSISKIRLWETEGLVEPSRTPSGYRKFTVDDVERLRYAMTLQRDRYWPLRRIREHLDAVQRGAEDPVPGAGGPRPAPVAERDGAGAPHFLQTVGSTRLSADELCDRANLRADQLDDLVAFGLVQPSSSGWYDDVSAQVATAAGELAAFGIEPRHLRAFRTAAEREVGLVEQVVRPLLGQRGTASRARAEDVAGEISALSLRLHASLVRAGLARAGLG